MPHQESSPHRMNQSERLELKNGLDIPESEVASIVRVLKLEVEDLRLDSSRPIHEQLVRERRFWSNDIELKFCAGPGSFGKMKLNGDEVFVILREGRSYMFKLRSDCDGLKVVEKSLGPME